MRRCQLDIETASTDGGFPDAARPGDRVLAIGLRCGGKNRLLVLAEMTDPAEKALLGELNAALAERGLFFPVAHAYTVGMGGFLLQGGFGWNSRADGLACQSVIGRASCRERVYVLV